MWLVVLVGVKFILLLFHCDNVQAAFAGKGNGKRWFNRRTGMYTVTVPV